MTDKQAEPQVVDNIEYHYWFLVVKVIGPQPHQIKEKTINLRTADAKFNKVDYNTAMQYAIAERAKEMGLDIDQFEAILYGPNYAGHMTSEQFEGNISDEHNGSEQG